jgi:hypothetical protein
LNAYGGEGQRLQSVDESVQTLVNLRLTVLQAKVYIALAKSGTSTGKTTAKVAQVRALIIFVKMETKIF